MIAYIITQGARIIKEGHHLIVESDKLKHTLFVSKLEQLLIFGNISLTPQARHLLLKENIDTVFLQKNGKYMGRLFSSYPRNAALRKKQFNLIDDYNFRLNLSRSFIYGKIKNQSTILSRIKRTRNKLEAGNASRVLYKYIGQLKYARTLEEIRGIEGRAAAIYFESLRFGLNQDWGFIKRIRNPPRDPVNVILSFLYTLLASLCTAALHIVGLDTQPGVLHELSYSRDSLSLDLMEEFRPLIVDTLTLALFNLKVLTLDSFYEVSEEKEENNDVINDIKENKIDLAVNDSLGQITNYDTYKNFDYADIKVHNDENSYDDDKNSEANLIETPPSRLLLTQDACKAILSAWSKKLETEFIHPQTGKLTTYSKAIVYQAKQIKQIILGDIEKYTPLTLR